MTGGTKRRPYKGVLISLAELMEAIVSKNNKPERGQTTIDDLRNDIGNIAGVVEYLARELHEHEMANGD